MPPYVPLILVLLAAYLAGSCPTSLLVSRRVKGIDIREYGSGNAGATNVLRSVGWKAALFVAAVDVGKGALAAGVLPLLLPKDGPLDRLAVGSLAGACAVVGHVFPVFAGFRGGKGVGTAAGMMAVLHPLSLLACVPVFAGVVLLTRMVSLASMLGALAFPLSLWALRGNDWVEANPVAFWTTVGIAAFIVFTHRSNVRRILSGTENRFGPSRKNQK
jgi:acyl phosphate:glycerol-3-phosphate acyltransferase